MLLSGGELAALSDRGEFRRWFRALPDADRFGLLQDYVLGTRRGDCLNYACWRTIIEELRGQAYLFRLHTALPFSGKEKLTSKIGHMWITIENPSGTASIALGFYPAKRGLRNLLFGRGALRVESGRGHYEYGLVSTAILPEDIIRIVRLARMRFSRATYSVGGWFGGADCTVFAAAACRIARLVVPDRDLRLWTYWPLERIEAMYEANRHRSGVHCALNPSAWENQRHRIAHVLRRIFQACRRHEKAIAALLPVCRVLLIVGRYVLPVFLLVGALLAWAMSGNERRGLRKVGLDAA